MSRERSWASRLLDQLQEAGQPGVIAPQRKVEGRLDVDVPGRDGWPAALRRVLVPPLVLVLLMMAWSHMGSGHPGFIYADF